MRLMASKSCFPPTVLDSQRVMNSSKMPFGSRGLVHLPSELILNILEELNYKDLLSCKLVSSIGMAQVALVL